MRHQSTPTYLHSRTFPGWTPIYSRTVGTLLGGNQSAPTCRHSRTSSGRTCQLQGETVGSLLWVSPSSNPWPGRWHNTIVATMPIQSLVTWLIRLLRQIHPRDWSQDLTESHEISRDLARPEGTVRVPNQNQVNQHLLFSQGHLHSPSRSSSHHHHQQQQQSLSYQDKCVVINPVHFTVLGKTNIRKTVSHKRFIQYCS